MMCLVTLTSQSNFLACVTTLSVHKIPTWLYLSQIYKTENSFSLEYDLNTTKEEKRQKKAEFQLM